MITVKNQFNKTSSLSSNPIPTSSRPANRASVIPDTVDLDSSADEEGLGAGWESQQVVWLMQWEERDVIVMSLDTLLEDIDVARTRTREL